MVQSWMLPAAFAGLAWGIIGLALVALSWRAEHPGRDARQRRAERRRALASAILLAGITVTSAALAVSLWP